MRESKRGAHVPNLRTLGWTLSALLVASPLAGQVPPAMPGMDHSMPAGEPMRMRTREGSGTSWLPDETPMAAVHAWAGGWALMLHGNAFLQYISEGGDRGDSQLGSVNWVMGMARRSLAGGQFGLRAMLSAEPFTIPKCGYPILLASGETCDGEPIHDAQHPHDLFMELGAEYERQITQPIGFQLYAAVSGEPALGPVAFPHRTSAMPNPLAPISHHWFDATHIAFGVVTAGVFGDKWKLEGSLFNGREPDEDRENIDLAALDSYAGRLSWLPTERLAIQVSAGQLNEAEPGHGPGDPRMDMKRYTTSLTYHRPLASGGIWANTAALGRNVEMGEASTAALLESSLSLADRHVFFGRAELAEKSGHDLQLPSTLEHESFNVGSVALGYTYQIGAVRGWLPGIGARGSVSFVPEDLEPTYGSRTPAGFTVFLSLRPNPMGMEMEMPMQMGAATRRSP